MVGGPEIILLYLLVILAGAKIGGEAASRLKQPPVVGEILVGVILGPSVLHFIPPFEVLDAIGSATSIDAHALTEALDLRVLEVLAQLGVLILLFEVGLESNLREFARVGGSAALVGTLGVVVSLVAGAAASWLIAREVAWVLTDHALAQPHLLHIFIGATLTATSVGITARVLGELGRIRTREAQIILGAAVFDDVLGLIVLAIVGGLVVNPAGLDAVGIGKVLVYALGFFFAAIGVGVLLAPRLIDLAHKVFRTPFVHLGFAFLVMLLGSYLASLVGLAPIVGAFAGGLALSVSDHRHVIFEGLKPVGSLFIGFFFVVLGIRVDLSTVTAGTLPYVVGIGVALTVVGILAKLLAGFGVLRRQASKYVVGVGMVPRGEVGLIFALFGLEHELLTNWQYTTIIIVVLLTTLVAPFWLKSLSGRFLEERLPEPPGQARLQESVTQ